MEAEVKFWVTYLTKADPLASNFGPKTVLRGRFVGRLDPASEEEGLEEGARRRKGDYAGLCREFW